MLIAQSTLSHIRQLDGTFGTRVHEPIAAYWMELGGSDDFRKLFHVGRLNIDNVEALVLDVEVPEVDPQIVATNESLAVAVYRYAVDVVGVCIGVCLSWHSRNDGIVMCKTR
jgi:hypothetical protein